VVSIEPFWELLTELLAPAEMDHLMGIHIGVNGMEAILNRNIAARLQISDDQSKKIFEAILHFRRMPSFPASIAKHCNGAWAQLSGCLGV